MINVEQSHRATSVYFFALAVCSTSLLFAWMYPEYVEVGMILPGLVALGFMFYNEQNILALFKPASFSSIVYGIGLPVAASLVALYLIVPIFHARIVWPSDWDPILNGVWLALPITLLVVIAQELCWRGYLQRILDPLLRRSTSVKTMITLSKSGAVAILWGVWYVLILAMRGADVITLFLAFLTIHTLSALYGWLFERHESLWPTIIAHTLHLVLFGQIMPKILIVARASDSAVLLGPLGLFAAFSYTVLGAIFIYLLLLNMIKGRKKLLQEQNTH